MVIAALFELFRQFGRNMKVVRKVVLLPREVAFDLLRDALSAIFGLSELKQQNRRQEAAKVYVAAPAKGRGYAGNLPWCNRCKAHHQPGPCPPRCGKCHKLGHQEGECRTRIPVAGGNSLQNVTCFGCGNHGHYRSDCPELKNRN
ncbi:reverse transcriptase domain-containing protein [Tanacetum coccineum]|uniref:Reverse transcriptase domain-containing protein n=1 Tax=Tanacetum coccineum TaxID=301880 RepID=A0ABQ5ETW2_9ASTR